MQFDMAIDMEGAAFDETPASELARILREFADKVESGNFHPMQPIRDINGNRIGTARFKK